MGRSINEIAGAASENEREASRGGYRLRPTRQAATIAKLTPDPDKQGGTSADKGKRGGGRTHTLRGEPGHRARFRHETNSTEVGEQYGGYERTRSSHNSNDEEQTDNAACVNDRAHDDENKQRIDGDDQAKGKCKRDEGRNRSPRGDLGQRVQTRNDEKLTKGGPPSRGGSAANESAGAGVRTCIGQAGDDVTQLTDKDGPPVGKGKKGGGVFNRHAENQNPGLRTDEKRIPQELLRTAPTRSHVAAPGRKISSAASTTVTMAQTLGHLATRMSQPLQTIQNPQLARANRGGARFTYMRGIITSSPDPSRRDFHRG